ncbi:DUF4395 domain-containing protein [Brevibacillus sp. SYP-B805]|uniref:DUF4395 domain-containing protein n=1 Tax=Brevibacillus sp. SYP-B805 TaxID=1578199 RepID=UPI0013EB819D|nr:DUF4395 domain-containing protein [Brevibacillus sp. SYP-B805]NGQ94502.1 DUF4395 domain-containing protein [Brevibacillus sp. SYP-B805]
MERPRSIPRPLVRTNQWFLVISVIATWLSGSEWILALPLGTGLLGLLFGFNPVMWIAKHFLRKPPDAYIPEDWDQQQFNQIIAVVCLVLGLIGYVANWPVMAYVFTAMVALAAFIAILGFCIGCFIRYQWLQYTHKKSAKHLS